MKTVLVTGANIGLGKECARQLASVEGVEKIYLGCRNQEKAEAWQAEVKEQGFDIKIYQADVSDYDACEKMVEQVVSDLGPIDILVNNAGITKDGMFKKMTKDKWDTVMNINVDSLFNVTKHVVESMSERGWGRIVNIASINGQKGQIGQTNYTTSKAAMHGFTKSLAQEVARKGVTVNTVSPGYIATEMVMAVPEDIRNQIISGIPVNRLGTSEEVAALVGFLCSEEAGFATGADFSMNGGQHMM